jgi:Ca2+-binding RTX toxin-like protein
VATDKDGGASSVAEHLIDVRVIDVQPDPWNPGALAVLVGGTNTADKIDFSWFFGSVLAIFRRHTSAGWEIVTAIISPHASGFNIDVEFELGSQTIDIHAFSVASNAPLGRLIAYGQDGADTLRVSKFLGIDALLFGGPGDDDLVGGGGDNVLLGEDGDDALYGGEGRDLLVGGLGRDRMYGRGEQDLLIGGHLQFTDMHTALGSLMETWSDRSTAYLDRITAMTEPAEVFALIDGVSVFDDNERDFLFGNHDLDWYLANEDVDQFQFDVDEVFTEIAEGLLDF